jgi:hypothetical protein
MPFLTLRCFASGPIGRIYGVPYAVSAVYLAIVVPINIRLGSVRVPGCVPYGNLPQAVASNPSPGQAGGGLRSKCLIRQQ